MNVRDKCLAQLKKLSAEEINSHKKTRFNMITDRIKSWEIDQSKFEKDVDIRLNAAGFQHKFKTISEEVHKKNDRAVFENRFISNLNPKDKERELVDIIKGRRQTIDAVDRQREEFAKKLIQYINEAIGKENQKVFRANPKIEVACVLLQKILEWKRDISLLPHEKILNQGSLGIIFKEYQNSALSELLDPNALQKLQKKVKNTARDAEKQLAFKLADMGQKWRISNIDFFGAFHKLWQKLRGGKNVPFVQRLDDMQEDAINRVSIQTKEGKFQPVGNCWDQARTNLLFLATQDLSGNEMDGKTVLHVGSTTADHSYVIVTRLTIGTFIKSLSDKILSVDIEKLKKDDPDAYIIDSWRMGVYNEPECFLHWKPYTFESVDSKKSIRENIKNLSLEDILPSKPKTVVIAGIAIAGNPESIFQYDKPENEKGRWKPAILDMQKLNSNPGWKKFKSDVYGRETPSNILKVMAQKIKAIITYLS